MKYFPGQEKVREFCGWSGKFRKDFESQVKVREFENKRLWQAVLRKFIYSVQHSVYSILRHVVNRMFTEERAFSRVTYFSSPEPKAPGELIV